MKGSRNYKLLCVVLSIFLMTSLSVNVLGASQLIEIRAHLNNGIKITLHGELFEATDPVDGSKYVPITYKDRTYLPLRAVAEAVGLEVLWDGRNNTAHLGSDAGEITKDELSWTRVSPEYAPGSESEYRLRSRQPEYLDRAADKQLQFGYAILPDHGAGVSITVNTNFEYDKFRATFWLDDDQFYDDGGYIQSPEIKIEDEFGSIVKEITEDIAWGQSVDVEIDVKDVERLYVWVRGGLSIIGEPMIGK